jgi:hypothetical protein
MNLEWAKKRKIVYAAISGSIIILAGIYVFRDVIFPTPTCFDTKQNGYESGVDCGGVCSLRCSQEVIPLSITWARALKTASTSYDLVALVSNKNIDNAPRQILYTFIAYNAEGKEIAKINGASIAPIDGDFPIVEQNVSLSEEPRTVSAVIHSNVPHFKVLENPISPTLRIVYPHYEAGSIPRVYATITNTKRTLFRNLAVRVLLYDADGNVYAAGQTIVPTLDKEASREIVFTWDRAFPITPTKIRIFPILDPFLGSL